MIAALPMYDLPELRAATDAWWGALAHRMSEAGLQDVPASLERARPIEETWRDPSLLFGQTCGYPLVKSLSRRVRVVGTPSYRAEGCGEGTYRSVVVVPERSTALVVADLAGSRLVVNDPNSHSGMNALRALVAPTAGRSSFFATMTETGSHRASVAALRDGRADVASIDAVTYALLGDAAPTELDGIRILTRTDPAPCLPYVTALDTTDETLAALRRAVFEACADPELSDTRDRLRIRGFAAADVADYAPILDAENVAIAVGCRTLA